MMQVAICGPQCIKQALMPDSISTAIEVIWVKEASQLLQYREADAYIDLQFQNSGAYIEVLQQLLPRPVIINSVAHTLSETDASFIRINGWPTFLDGALVEASGNNAGAKATAEKVFQNFGKQLEWLPDEAGFVTPRVVSMIINEAYFALAEGVSTKEEIDVAMKLGTAYPYGPFAWSQQIGLPNIVELLNAISQQQSRYTPAPLLVQEAANGF